MKKKLVMVLMAVMVATAALGGCGQKGAGTGTSVSAEEEQDVEISAKELLKATDYKVEKYVKLNDYMNMTVELSQDYSVTDDAIQSYIEYLMSQYPSYEVSDKKTVESGDIVNIDYVGKVDGEEFSGGSATGQHLTIGSGSFIDGFEDGLIGKNVGDTVDLNLKFPDDYNNTDLAGKDVVFTVTINSIDTQKEMTYDDLTDEYVSQNFSNQGITTVDGLKSKVSSTLEQQVYSNKMSEIQSGVLSKLLEECEVTIPDGLLDQRISEYKDRVNKAVEESGKSFEDYMGMTEDDFNDQVSDYIEESLKQELILEAIVKDQNISISEKNFETFVDSYVSQYGIADRDTFYKEYGGEDYVRLSYAENQALSKVMDSVKTTVADSSDSSDTGAADSSADAE
ncbi:trigger factor [uncultured Eubacterium sp.]|uniref:trigger factor n=1 Tax=uncultured Eubacterium sp. TaxID=165185 RepID=UPI0025E434D2|nr:trigger factor [uncultured Eubacterium sp.]